ncbi:MAG: accessory gene regulator B family protein [Ruminococcus sp.]|nr:accessory gene regulator B family protein [Ruminococcus sp.]
MLHNISTRIATRFFDENDKYPSQVYVYGIELLISGIISTLLILGVGVVTRTFLESVLFLAFFSGIRVYTGGYHAMTYLRCNLLSVGAYVLVAAFMFFLGDFASNVYVLGAGYLLTMLTVLLLAPVGNVNKELTPEDRVRYKRISLVIITLSYGLCLGGYFLLGIEQLLIILPTCLTIDIAMVVPVVTNKLIRRNQDEVS